MKPKSKSAAPALKPEHEELLLQQLHPALLDCPFSRQEIASYVAGTLPASLTRQLESHLEKDAVLAAFIESERKQFQESEDRLRDRVRSFIAGLSNPGTSDRESTRWSSAKPVWRGGNALAARDATPRVVIEIPVSLPSGSGRRSLTLVITKTPRSSGEGGWRLSLGLAKQTPVPDDVQVPTAVRLGSIRIPFRRVRNNLTGHAMCTDADWKKVAEDVRQKTVEAAFES